MPCDYSKYPADWKTKIRPDILQRANHCCEECGVKNYSLVFRGMFAGNKVYQTQDANLYDEETNELIMNDSEYAAIECYPENKTATRIVLTIAHLDHDITNNDYSNLKALCQLHHLKHDVGHHKKTRRKNKGLQELF